jgi:predicted unusual protein kinase regulating ubiquinone biosynthesis (AarF/ABC1/UbiB family)
MKRILLIFGLLLAAVSLQAQEVERTAPVDSLLLGKNIFTVMGPGVKVDQSAEVKQAMAQYVGKNASKSISGYRIRVFYDNTPQARTRSEAIENALMDQYPEHKVYRSFESPNYKVLIGNFRSKDEALRIFNALKKTYPTAYIIKDNIEYPL